MKSLTKVENNFYRKKNPLCFYPHNISIRFSEFIRYFPRGEKEIFFKDILRRDKNHCYCIHTYIHTCMHEISRKRGELHARSNSFHRSIRARFRSLERLRLFPDVSSSHYRSSVSKSYPTGKHRRLDSFNLFVHPPRA